MPASGESATPSPPESMAPSVVGRWAHDNSTTSEEELAKIAGVSKKRIRECLRVHRQLAPHLRMIVDAQIVNIATATALCGLREHNEQHLLAAAIVHEAQISNAPVSETTVKAVIKERREKPHETIEETMDRVAGLRFHAQPNIITVSTDLPKLYRAAWQWGDESLADYIQRAPARLAAVSQALAATEVTSTLKLPGQDGPELQVTVSIETAQLNQRAAVSRQTAQEVQIMKPSGLQ